MSDSEIRTNPANGPSLDGPIAKLRRAHQHLSELYQEINAYIAEERHRVVSEREDLDGEQIYTLRLEVIESLGNPGWGLLVGDYIQNLRAALDHLVWQLVLLNEEEPGRANQFPISSDHDRYWNASDKRPSDRDRTLAGVAERHRERIDRVQPFTAPPVDGLALDYHRLAVLARLSNIDKHQLITGAFVSIGEVDQDMFDISTGDGSGLAEFEIYQHALFADLIEIAKIRMIDVRPGVGVRINVELPLEIGFGYPKGVRCDGLGMIYEFVRDLVKGFADDFARP